MIEREDVPATTTADQIGQATDIMGAAIEAAGVTGQVRGGGRPRVG